MNYLNRRIGILAVTFVTMLLGTTTSQAQTDVRMQISARETYVGMPVTLYLQVEDGATGDAPEFPEIDGLEIRSGGTPSRNSSITIINGRRSESSSVTYSYQFVPRREGTFEIPSIEIETANGRRITQSIQISVTKSETGDLMFAEVVGQKDQVYVGQPIELTLKIWLKPYRDKQHNVTISASDMWRMIAQNSQWGPFAKALEEMSARGQSLRGREVLREDEQGVKRSYYLYEIAMTFYPKRVGEIEMEEVQVVAQYPTRLGQSRDPFASFFGDSPFGGRTPFGGNSPFGSMLDDDFFTGRGSPFGRSLAVAATRPIVVTPEVESVEVIPIPTAGRPADYRGSVGQYEMITRATPTKVKAGDPITLKIGIRGSGPMELVQAPPLAEIQSLASDFKVSDEPLAGVVQDDIKVFTTTIRPRREGISHVPAIPFSFFDPDRKEFVTVRSEPVSIEVEKAEKLALDSIVRTSEDQPPDSASIELADFGPELANVSGQSLLANQTTRPDPGFWMTLFLTPAVLLVAVLLGRHRQRWIPTRESRAAFRDINSAKEVREVAKSILDLIAAKRGRPANLTRQEAIDEIEGLVDSSTVNQVEAFLISCENAAFMGGARIPLKKAQQEASELASRLKGLPRRYSGTRQFQRPWRLVAVTALTLIIVAFTSFSLVTAFQARAAESYTLFETAIELNKSQQTILLAEANEAYQTASQAKVDDAAEANSGFALAAQKYQTLVDSGINNSDLYFNLGNAYLQSNSIGRAIANYKRAQKLRPFDRRVHRNLSFAMTLTNNSNSNVTAAVGIDFRLVGNWLMQVPTTVWLTWLSIGWIGLCLIIISRLCRPRRQLHYLTISAILILSVAGGLLIASAAVANPFPTAVVVGCEAPVYQGDGEEFPQLTNIAMKEGDSVHIIQRRGDWLQIRSASGQQGWTKAELLEQV